MGEMNIAPHRRYRRLKSLSGGDLSRIADNKLERQSDAPLFSLRWVTDLTHTRLQEGWLYETVVLGLSPRRVIGWSLSSKAAFQSVIGALLISVMAPSAQRTRVVSL